MVVLFRIFCTGGFMSSLEARGNLKYSHYSRTATCIRPTSRARHPHRPGPSRRRRWGRSGRRRRRWCWCCRPRVRLCAAPRRPHALAALGCVLWWCHGRRRVPSVRRRLGSARRRLLDRRDDRRDAARASSAAAHASFPLVHVGGDLRVVVVVVVVEAAVVGVVHPPDRSEAVGPRPRAAQA